MKILGEKIRQARIIRERSITELADELGVSKQAVFQYENNMIEPKSEIIFKLSSILDFPTNFFTIPYSDEFIKTNTFFRALLSANKSEKLSLEEKTMLILRFYRFLQNYLDLPELNLPRFEDAELKNKNFDDLALKARNFWKLDNKPILNMVNLLEENGIIISTVKVPDKRIDAFTQTHNNNLFCVILEDTKISMARKNFSLAHELGHILLHSSGSFDELEKTEQRQIEHEADSFAAAFLLPRYAFNDDLKKPYDLDAYVPLKQKWNVSIFAMIMRAKSLNRINDDIYLSLIKKYSYRKYRTCEPLDDIIPIKKPILFEQSLKLLFDNNCITIDSLLNEMASSGLSLNLQDITKFFALEKNFFTPYLKPKNIGITLKMQVQQ